MWPVDHRRGLVSKVPEVTIAFWITKILTTGMGETASDYLVHRIGNAPAVLLGALAFTVALALQFRAPRYVAGIYWLAVVMVSVFGTMVADVLHIGLGIPYAVSTVFFMVALAVVFFTWQKVEGTLSIHSIFTPRRELFYWAAVLTTFSLGTAAGDLTAIVLHLGYFSSGLLFALIITLPALAFWRSHLNSIAAFWLAYIVTRPLGASFADWMAVSHLRGGLAWGNGAVSIGWALVILGFVVYLAASRTDRVVHAEPEAEPAA